jgi:hypothetical protein
LLWGDAATQIRSLDAMNFESTQPTGLPKESFDKSLILFFDGAVAATDDYTELQNEVVCAGKARCFGVDNRESEVAKRFVF